MLINYKGINIYQDDKLVLGNVDFHIEQSEFVYLIGKVGSGKSSLLKTIYCELDIDSDDEEAVADVLGRDLKKIRNSRFKKRLWYYFSRLSIASRLDCLS